MSTTAVSIQKRPPHQGVLVSKDSLTYSRITLYYEVSFFDFISNEERGGKKSYSNMTISHAISSLVKSKQSEIYLKKVLCQR